jgi:signal transduction histidine kinase/HAMP domain-containing protein
MTIDFWGFHSQPSYGLPLQPAGVLLFVLEFLLLCTVMLLRWDYRTLVQRMRYWFKQPVFLALLAAAPLAAQLFVVRFPAPALLAVPGVPSVVRGPAFAVFNMLPWLLAAGLLGDLPAVLVAFLGGVTRGAFETHSIFTPLHFAFSGMLVAWLLRQSYAEWPGRSARNPLVAGLLAGLGLSLLRSLESFLYSGGSFYDRLDYVLTLYQSTALSSIFEGVVAGAILYWLVRSSRIPWYQPSQLSVGPYNRSLAARLLSLLLVLGFLSSSSLVLGDWLLAQRSAADLLERQMIQTAHQASSAIPYFVQTGRSIGMHMAARSLDGLDSSEELQGYLRTFSFYDSVTVYDAELNLVASYPGGSPVGEGTPFELAAGLDAALGGIPQEVILRPEREASSVRMAFLTPIPAEEAEQAALGVVAGVTSLDTNPYLLPIIEIFRQLEPEQAFITDLQGTILIHPDPARILQPFEAEVSTQGVTSDNAPDGTRRLIYREEVRGYPWRVWLIIPQQEIQKSALRLAASLFGVVIGVGGIALVAVYLISRRLTYPLRQMAGVAQSIARGNLAQPVQGEGEDEIGRLATSFERMRRRLKARLDEMSLLLTASQQVSRSFDLSTSMPPILHGLREITHADLVRLALNDPNQPGNPAERFNAGEDPGNWGALDEQVLELTSSKGRFTLENPARAKAVLDIQALSHPLESMTAVPLRHEDVLVGALWLGYRYPHVFSPDDLRLLSILAAQLGVAIANARLYHQAEQERSRLTAVLEATPDAVLLLDAQDKILLANPATEMVLDRAPEDALGQPGVQVIEPAELTALLFGAESDSQTAEIQLPGGQVLFASVSSIEPEDSGTSGRVCVLWDITHYKKLDTLKSEFVSTVSHDLRAPLTLMRGYATMLSMVGAMNDQQKEFVSKILGSADQMGALIENLLDLGRIEAGVGLDLEPIAISTMVEGVMTTYRPQAVNKQIELSAELDPGLEPVEADATMLRQCLANLVDNALKYTTAGGSVRVKAYQQDLEQVIEVEDTGLGIAPTDQARLFEKFYRARRRETLAIKGSGLGLAIVRSIIQQHGGKVSVESKLGEGSTFRLSFPIHQADREIAPDATQTNQEQVDYGPD